jgi:hypothetical protein
MTTCHHVKTLPATSSSWPNLETLDACEVLAHLSTTFHPCTCGLCGDAAMVASALISYDDVEVAVGTTTRRRRSLDRCSYSSSTTQHI